MRYLYLIERASELVTYDETDSAVIVASTPDEARVIAESLGGDQGGGV